jgi:hypothetical protein
MKRVVVVLLVAGVALFVWNRFKADDRAQAALADVLCNGELDTEIDTYIIDGDRARMTGTIADGANAQLMWNATKRSSLARHVPALRRMFKPKERVAEATLAIATQVNAQCPEKFPDVNKARQRALLFLALGVPQE